MADHNDSTDPRPVGEARWKADRDAIERRNAEAKRRASEHPSASTRAAFARERRLAETERAQIEALNERARARAAEGPPTA